MTTFPSSFLIAFWPPARPLGLPNSARLRLYYLDTTRMSAADLATWNANRCIEQTEAVALGWIRSK